MQCRERPAHLASSSEIDGVVLPSVSVRDLLGSNTVSMEGSLTAPTTSGNVNVATEVEGASTGERASLDKDSGGRVNDDEEGPKGGKFEGVGRRGGLETPQQLVKGMIGALWMGWTADELVDLNTHFSHSVHKLRSLMACPPWRRALGARVT